MTPPVRCYVLKSRQRNSKTSIVTTRPWSVEPKSLGDERNDVVVILMLNVILTFMCPCNVIQLQITANKMQGFLDLFIFTDATMKEMELQGTPRNSISSTVAASNSIGWQYLKFSWFQTFTVFCMLYVFFWVIPRRLNFICRRFGTLCLFHLHRQVGE